MKDQFDVLIMGAGIGGLVCGCFLARAGFKVAIVERKRYVGGYCSTIENRGFTFNWCIHSIGNYKEGGVLQKVLSEIGLENRVKIGRNKYTNTILTKDRRLTITDDLIATEKSLVDLFPKDESEISKFFNYILNTDSIRLYLDLKNKSALDFFNEFFRNQDLKNFLMVPVTTLASKLSTLPAFSLAIFFRDMLFDSGYYIKGGVQFLANALLDVFLKNGGSIFLNTKVSRLRVSGCFVKSAITEAGEEFLSRYIVSNIDIHQLTTQLIDEKFRSRFNFSITSRDVCYSAVLLHLASEKLVLPTGVASSIWYDPHYCTFDYLERLEDGPLIMNNTNFLLFVPSNYDRSLAPEGKDVCSIVALSPYCDQQFWKANKLSLKDRLIENANAILPGLSEKIIFSRMLLPQNLESYTLNYRGAIQGWAATFKNNNSGKVRQGGAFKNLFYVGHWSTLETGSGGITMASASGHRVSRMLKKEMA